MVQLTNKKILSLIKEEKQASKMYKGYGLPAVARDETRHSKILQSMIRRK